MIKKHINKYSENCYRWDEKYVNIYVFHINLKNDLFRSTSLWDIIKSLPWFDEGDIRKPLVFMKVQMLRILWGFRRGIIALVSRSQSNSVFSAAEFLRRSVCPLLGLWYDRPSSGREIQILLTNPRVPKYRSTCPSQSCILQNNINFMMVWCDIILSCNLEQK